MKARIPPLDPPYDDDTAAMLAKWMPPGADAEPLKLFRTLAVHPELMSRMRPLGAGILGSKTVAPRERELMILRTTALNGAFYEWGVHATAFGASVGITEDDARAIAAPEIDTSQWSDADAAILSLSDELHENGAVSDELWERLAATHSHAQMIELIATAGWYRLLSYVINAARIEPEPWALSASPSASS